VLVRCSYYLGSAVAWRCLLATGVDDREVLSLGVVEFSDLQPVRSSHVMMGY